MQVPPVPAAAVLDHIGPGADIIVPLAVGEPVTVLDAVEAAGETLERVNVHQMHALHDRPYLHGAFGDRLHHVSYFLSPVTRDRFADGTIDLVPNHFSEVPDLMGLRCTDPLVVSRAAGMIWGAPPAPRPKLGAGAGIT